MKEILKISPVIELNATEFSQKQYATPDGSEYDFPEEWEVYWKKCLGDTGLSELNQLIPGHPFVDLAKIEKDQLKIILEVHLKDTNLDKPDEIVTFEGGIAIEFQDTHIIPQCCTAIEDYRNWVYLINDKPNEWTQIWIGHPWIFARVRNNKVELSAYSNENMNTDSPETTIDIHSFTNELKTAVRTINAFKTSVTDILKSMQIKNAFQVANILVENEHPA